MSRPARAGHPEQSHVPSMHAPTGSAGMQERRANLHRLPARDCGEDTAESSSVPHGKASLCWAARLACCRHPAWLHASCLHQAPIFLQAPQSPQNSGHPGSTDVTLKGSGTRDNGWAAFLSLNSPRSHCVGRTEPALLQVLISAAGTGLWHGTHRLSMA